VSFATISLCVASQRTFIVGSVYFVTDSVRKFLEREDVAGSWRKLHNEELHNLYASPHIIRVIK
jgi:hypothetical protein